MLVSESYGGELEFLVEFFWVVDSSSVYECGLFHVFGEVFWFEFFEFVPFCYENARVCVFEAFYCRDDLLNFVFEDGLERVNRWF